MMNDCYKIDEAASLKTENECLRTELTKASDRASKFGIVCDEQRKEIDGLKEKIKFLEGQIDAYQYCMNCKR